MTTLPPHVIEAAAEAHYNSNQSRLGSWEWASFSTLSPDAQQEYRDSIRSSVEAALAALWQPAEILPKSGDEVAAYRPDAGWFAAFYGSCEHIHMTEREADQIDESSYFHVSWWGFFQDGVVRLEGDEAPTKWMTIPLPQEGESP